MCSSSSVEKDELKAIGPADWPTLRDMYRREWPKHEVAYNTIQNYINWNENDGRIKDLNIYGLNDSWRENATYIVVDRYQIYLYTLDESLDSLKRALELVDWDYSYMSITINDVFAPVLKEVFKSLALDRIWDQGAYIYSLPKEESLKFEIELPEGFYLGKPTLEQAAMANQLWPWHHEGSEYFVKRLAAWNPSVGLFNETGELVAWSFVWPNGMIGPLEVAKAHLRKGYGSIIVKAIAQELAKRGMSSFASIVHPNKISRAMFEKLGFTLAYDSYWVRNRSRKLVEYDH